MLYYIRCIDKPNASELRAATRPTHLEYLQSFGDKIKYAGPTFDDANQLPTGSMLIFEAENKEGGRRICCRRSLCQSLLVFGNCYSAFPSSDTGAVANQRIMGRAL